MQGTVLRTYHVVVCRDRLYGCCICLVLDVGIAWEVFSSKLTRSPIEQDSSLIEIVVSVPHEFGCGNGAG